MAKIIMPTDDIVVGNIRALIYGEVGVGKTTTAITSKNPVVLDAENGMGRAGIRVPFLPMDSYQDAMDNLPEMSGFGTIVVDTIDAFIQHIIRHVIKSGSKYEGAVKKGGDGLTLNGYGVVLNLFDRFWEKVEAQKQDLIFVAHAKKTYRSKTDQEGYTEPIITGKTYQLVMRDMTLCGYITGENGKRFIDFRPSYGHVGKDSADIGKIEIPTITPATAFTNPFMANVIDMVRARTANITKASADSEKFFKELSAKIETANDAESLTVLANESQEWPLAYKSQGKTLLNDIANARGFVWDKELKSFVR